MTIDEQQLDIEQQLERLGLHRERAVEQAPVSFGSATAIRPARMPAVLAAATVLILFATGAYLLLRAGDDTGSVDAIGRGDGTAELDPSPPDDGARSSGSGELDRPDTTSSGLFSELTDDPDRSTGDDDETEPAPESGDTSSAGAPSSSPMSVTSEPSETSEPTETSAMAPDPAADAIPQVDAAGEALSEASSLMVDLTAGLAGSDISDPEPADQTGRQEEQEELANDLAAAAARDHGGCVTPRLNPDLSVTLLFADCPAEDGRPVNGALTARVDRWIPLELNVVVAGLTVGTDRLWMDATLALPRAGGDPTLSGQILVESGGDVTYLEGGVRFRPGSAIIDGDLAYVTDTSVVGSDRVTYRPGQLIVTTDVVDLIVAEGSCAPSAGTARFRAHTVTGIHGGGSETFDLEKLILREDLSADVTYRPTTPLDGRVDLRLDGQNTVHQLQAPCR